MQHVRLFAAEHFLSGLHCIRHLFVKVNVNAGQPWIIMRKKLSEAECYY